MCTLSYTASRVFSKVPDPPLDLGRCLTGELVPVHLNFKNVVVTDEFPRLLVKIGNALGRGHTCVVWKKQDKIRMFRTRCKLLTLSYYPTNRRQQARPLFSLLKSAFGANIGRSATTLFLLRHDRQTAGLATDLASNGSIDSDERIYTPAIFAHNTYTHTHII